MVRRPQARRARRLAGAAARAAFTALAAAAALLVLALALAPRASSGSDGPVVFAAASFSGVLRELSPGGAHQGAGSDRLALQLRAGARADLMVAADPAMMARLHSDGLVGRPVPVARNALVIAVALRARGRVRAAADLAAPGVRVASAAPSVPLGRYARDALSRLGLERAVAANAVTEDPDALAVTAKVASGEVDAAVVYRTDAAAVAGRVAVVPIPPAAQPRIVYAAAVPRSAARPADGRRLIAQLRSPAGAAALRRHGFLPAP